MHGGEAAVMLTMFAGGFAMIFGIYYLKTRQNMAMIEKGMNPRQFANRPAPYKNLKWALLLIGAGRCGDHNFVLQKRAVAGRNSSDTGIRIEYGQSAVAQGKSKIKRKDGKIFQCRSK